MESHPHVPDHDHPPEYVAGGAGTSASSPSVNDPASGSSTAVERPLAEGPRSAGAERWLGEREQLDRLESKVDLLLSGSRRATAKRAVRESRVTGMLAGMADQDPAEGEAAQSAPARESLVRLLPAGGPPEARGGAWEAAPGKMQALRRKLASQPKMLAEVDSEVRAQGNRGALNDLREAAQEGARNKRPADVAPVDVAPVNGATVDAASDHSPRSSASASPSPTRRDLNSSKMFKTQNSSQDLSTRLRTAEVILTEIDKADDMEKNRVGLSTFTNQNDKKRMKLMRKATSFLMEEVEYGPVGKVVAGTHFDLAVTLVVVLNALLIGAQVQYNAVSDESSLFFQIAEYLCTLVFTVELCLRLSVHRQSFYLNPQERWWNMFDFSLVVIALVDTGLTLSEVTSGGQASFMSKLGRAIRLLRILRIIRVVKKLSQLRSMLHMIISSLESLFWVLVIMAGLIYMVAVVLTQGATDYKNGPSAPPSSASEHEQFLVMYGSLFSTMYTLFQSMSGGVSWGVASEAMRGPGWLLEAVVISYVFFMVFAVANIVNGIFVDGAIERSKRDRSIMLQKQKEDAEAKEKHVINLLTMMDTDGDNTISFPEFLKSLENEEIRDYITALDVDVDDAKVFFNMLDRDGSGTVDILEFASGMRRFRGEAKSVDMHMLMYESKRLFKLVCCLVGTICGEFEDEGDEGTPGTPVESESSD